MRQFNLLLGLLATLLVLTGCLKVDGTIKVEDDGSGRVDFISAVDKDALGGIFGGLGGFADGLTEDLGEDFGNAFSETAICDGFTEEISATELPGNAQSSAYDQDGFCGVRVQYELPAADDHSADISGLFEGGDTRLFKDGDKWIFDTVFQAATFTDTGDDFGIDGDDLFSDATFRIEVDLPGRAIAGQNNATTVGDDGRFVWDIDLLNPPARLFAQTEPGSGGGIGSGISGGESDGGINPLLIGLVLLAILGALAAFWFLKQRSGDSSPEGYVSPTTPVAGGLPATATMPAAMPVATEPVQTFPVQTTPAATIADGAKETIIMGTSAATADPVPATTDPVYDEQLGAWTVIDPARGLLRHDPATDTWMQV